MLIEDIVELFAKEYFHKIDCMPLEQWDRLNLRVKGEHLEKMGNILKLVIPIISQHLEGVELPDNQVWHEVDREFEAFCAGENAALKAFMDSLEVKDEN